MTYNTLNTNTKNYLLIDNMVISAGTIITFDLFIQTPKKQMIVVYSNRSKLTKDIEQQLLSEESLYINNKDKQEYEELFMNTMKQIVIPEKMENLYKEFSKSVDNIFDNPESPTTISDAKVVVTDMIDTIMSDDFTLSSLITILSYDYYTHTHSLNTSVYSLCIGKELNLDKEELEDLGTAALLHDLGKSKIDKSIINKNGKLTDAEFEEVKNHPAYGYELAQKLQIRKKPVLLGIRHHHEKMDGSGYPDKLKKDEIHLFAKIIGVCDIFDALTTKRSYKDVVSTFDTLMLMKKDMKNQLDMGIVNTLIRVFQK